MSWLPRTDQYGSLRWQILLAPDKVSKTVKFKTEYDEGEADIMDQYHHFLIINM